MRILRSLKVKAHVRRSYVSFLHLNPQHLKEKAVLPKPTQQRDVALDPALQRIAFLTLDQISLVWDRLWEPKEEPLPPGLKELTKQDWEILAVILAQEIELEMETRDESRLH